MPSREEFNQDASCVRLGTDISVASKALVWKVFATGQRLRCTNTGKLTEVEFIVGYGNQRNGPSRCVKFSDRGWFYGALIRDHGINPMWHPMINGLHDAE